LEMETRIRDLEVLRASPDQLAPQMEVDTEAIGVDSEVASGPSLHYSSVEMDMDGEDPADFQAKDLAWWQPTGNYAAIPMDTDGGPE
jgi:hypothetical protein